jgi:hypothetical protein
MKMRTLTSALIAAAMISGSALAVDVEDAQVKGVSVDYVPIYLNAASSNNGYIDESKGPVQAVIDGLGGFKLRNKGLAPKAGSGSDERSQRIYFTFGSTLSGATNLVLKASMTGVPAHSGTWRLTVMKGDFTTSSYACNFTDTSSNCYDGTDRIIKLSNIAGAGSGYIEVEGMPDGSEITFQKLRFTINDDGNSNTTAANEYDVDMMFK